MRGKLDQPDLVDVNQEIKSRSLHSSRQRLAGACRNDVLDLVTVTGRRTFYMRALHDDRHEQSHIGV